MLRESVCGYRHLSTQLPSVGLVSGRKDHNIPWISGSREVIGWVGLRQEGPKHTEAGKQSRRRRKEEGGERKEKEKEKPNLIWNFLRILCRNLKICEHESCREFKDLQLLF